MRSPSSIPSPRKLLSDERFALSKLDLNTSNMPSLSVMRFSVSAVRSCSSSLSTTQGPEIRKMGWSRPTSRPNRFMGGALAERFDHRHRAPVADTVLRGESLGKWLAGMDSALDEDEVEALSRGTERVGLQRIANHQHLAFGRMASVVQGISVNGLIWLAVPGD